MNFSKRFCSGKNANFVQGQYKAYKGQEYCSYE
jgi:hypothetical protein